MEENTTELKEPKEKEIKEHKETIVSKEVKEDNVSSRKTKIKNSINDWLKDPYNKVFLAIFIIAVIIRLYYLIKTIDQAVWWDSAEYLTAAKVLSHKMLSDYQITPRRTFFLPFVWAGLLTLGFGEVSFRILEFLFSVAAIPAMYLFAKEVFNKKIALLSSFIMAVFWMQIFYSNKLMTEIPSLTFLIFSFYFFWKGYYKDKPKLLVYFGICLGLGFLVRAGTLVMFAVFPLYLLIAERFKFLKNKYLWYGGLWTLFLAGSFFVITSIIEKTNAFVSFLSLTTAASGTTSTRFSDIMGPQGMIEYSKFFYDPATSATHYLGLTLLVVFIFGLFIFLMDFVLTFDLVLKGKDHNSKKYLYILLIALVPFLFQSILVNHAEDRYLMNAFPALFIISALGLVKIEEYVGKYSKYIALGLIIFILFLGAYQELTYGNQIIVSKIGSYKEIKDAGLWIKANSPPTANVMTLSYFQIGYYSERNSYEIPPNQTEFEKKIYEKRPDFLVLSIFETHDPWMYEYPANHTNLLIPVQAYTISNQPVVVIYKFNYTGK